MFPCPYLRHALVVVLLGAVAATHEGDRHQMQERRERAVKGGDGSRVNEFTMDSCKNVQFAKMFSTVMVESKCSKPLATLVELVRPTMTSVYIPNKVRVKRCQGMCYTQQECVALETRNVTLSVREQNLVTHEVTCGMVTVEEHIRCMCKCAVMKAHCNHIQMYIPSQCKCECMNPELMYDCLKVGKKWNDSKCRCECSGFMECTTGQSWDRQSCTCITADQRMDYN